MDGLFHFPDARRRHPDVEAWLARREDALGELARGWFGALREAGGDVRELLHDGHPTACVGDAAFAYVDAFTAHVSVGFYRGAELEDPQGLLEGGGRFMRHVKLRPDGAGGEARDEAALVALLAAAYDDMRRRLGGA